MGAFRIRRSYDLESSAVASPHTWITRGRMSVQRVPIRLEPLSIEVELPRGSSLVSGLSAHGFEFPCGGTGLCGGCGVRVRVGSLPVTDGDQAAFSTAELADGWRL